MPNTHRSSEVNASNRRHSLPSVSRGDHPVGFHVQKQITLVGESRVYWAA
jgi:hypothetical protein